MIVKEFHDSKFDKNGFLEPVHLNYNYTFSL